MITCDLWVLWSRRYKADIEEYLCNKIVEEALTGNMAGNRLPVLPHRVMPIVSIIDSCHSVMSELK